MEDDEEIRKPFLCRDVISDLILDKKSRQNAEIEFKTLYDMPVVEMAVKKTLAMIELQNICQHSFLLVQQTKNCNNVLLFDGRFLKEEKEGKRKVAVYYFLPDGSNKKDCFSSSMCLPPRLSPINYRQKGVQPKEPIWELLGLDPSTLDPQSIEEVASLLSVHDIQFTEISICVVPPPHKFVQYWIYPLTPLALRLEAYTDNNYKLAFRRQQQPDQNIRFQPPTRARPASPRPAQTSSSPFSLNSSASVSVSLTGLNAAYNLGLLSTRDFETVSRKMGALGFAAMWVELDNAGHARYITILDAVENNLEFFEVARTNAGDLESDEASWTKMFKALFKLRQKSIESKTSLLQPLVDHLQHFAADVSNPWNSVLISLKAAISKFVVITYCKTDAVLHALKLHFVHHMKGRIKKNFRGVSIKSSPSNDIVSLDCTEMMILNCNCYSVELKDEEEEEIIIKNSVRSLSHQSRQAGNMTMIQYCKSRGAKMAAKTSQSWIKLGEHFLSKFLYDIHCLPSTSLAAISFKCIWTKYSRLSGPYQHGIEKVKQSYEQVLRNHSQGGFSYSCESKLNVGDALHDEDGPRAQSLQELDISSSYGYAASTMTVPRGFCTGYISDGGRTRNLLVRTDKVARYKSFEFRSVYYTIWKMQQSGQVIWSVYSNFHMLGYITLGNFPLDLVIVTSDGRIHMYQFDGQVILNFFTIYILNFQINKKFVN